MPAFYSACIWLRFLGITYCGIQMSYKKFYNNYRIVFIKFIIYVIYEIVVFTGKKALSTAKKCCAQIVQVLNTQIFCTFHVHCAMYIVFIHCYIYICCIAHITVMWNLVTKGYC